MKINDDKRQRTCEQCAHLDTSDVIALCDGVGWCRQAGQYRSLRIERECDSYTENEKANDA